MLKPTEFASTKERVFENLDNVDHNSTNADPAEGLMLGSVLRTWTQISRINYFSSQPFDIIKSGQTIRRKSIGVPPKDRYSIHDLVSKDERMKSQEEVFNEQFPANLTNLMNENQLWGSFYIFPELYADVYSPTVQILNEDKVTGNDSGILTRDLVACCLSYLARTPILKNFVYIKLNLAGKDLQDIDVLRHYKYIIYLDLSENDIKDLTVLSYLPYLQYLSVSVNKLENVLEYEPEMPSARDCPAGAFTAGTSA
ncbi:Leucine-rich repeat and guanylate kinase domain-containing protein [Eumeta japonica]|uniref:Leucine-rich repeat and guanylate kinase domain-containing protein n=1 Tax=Eumeta variegata TaxID=151549 RepID=A0A4C1TRZ6_EUMVA|nr:Leucine-rich repeat and guanylate kinase domain-containing protein [Eumeta japonica]